jgi:hypothetical protein
MPKMNISHGPMICEIVRIEVDRKGIKVHVAKLKTLKFL